nr:MAG TPA: hypothetical protein [Caudoviricetes sp.]DAU70267.1 MAG TPA: hypothetical protein [Caudoviricetes sp.]
MFPHVFLLFTLSYNTYFNICFFYISTNFF